MTHINQNYKLQVHNGNFLYPCICNYTGHEKYTSPVNQIRRFGCRTSGNFLYHTS